MTVKQLKKLLDKHPDDMRCISQGYEGGHSDVGEPKQIFIKLNVNSAWYYGSHEEVDKDKSDETALNIG